MANGVYRPGSAADQDCQATSSAYDNSGNNAYIGNANSTDNQYHALFNLDIPKDATIDSAYLYLYCDNRLGTVNGSVTAEDSDDASAYTSNPYSRSQIGTSVTWNGMLPTVWEWDKSPDIKTVIQAIVNRSGWASGNAIGLVVTAPGLGSNNYVRTIQSNYGGKIYPVLIVEWHTLTKYVRASTIAASADDTYNKDNDTTDNRSAAFARFGHDGTNSFRAFFRFNAKVHKGSDVTSIDGAHLIVAADSQLDTTGWYGSIGTLEDESSFPSGSSVYSRSLISGQTAVNWSVEGWSAEGVYVSPDIANPISYRVEQEGYDPDGSGDAPYIGIRIDQGDANAKNEYRNICAYDRTGLGDFLPTLVVAYTIATSGNATVNVPALDMSLAADVPAVEMLTRVNVPALDMS
ncbi:MAG: hypothetical protein AB1384_12485, partial [Actinomycetota bacterium]